MDVWDWIESLCDQDPGGMGERLRADTVALAAASHNNDTDRLEALTHTVLDHARVLDTPWLEVFAKHWRLAGLRRDGRGEVLLADATALFELAHQERNRGCPQSVCSVQDLCIAYGGTDGPGYAEDRIAVATEALGRIDADWNCFMCLTSEWVSGLADAGRTEEAEAVLDSQVAKAIANGDDPDHWSLDDRVSLLMSAQRWDEALVVLERYETVDVGEWRRRRQQQWIALCRAAIYARTGRPDDAWLLLPDPSEVKRWGLGMVMAMRAVEALVATGTVPNSSALGAVGNGYLRHLVGFGAHRDAFDLAAIQARLALERGARWVAVDALAVMRSERTLLRADAGADAVLAEVASAVAAADQAGAPLPVPVSDLIEYLAALDDHDEEQEVEWLRAATLADPHNLSLVTVQASLLVQVGRTDLALQLIDDARTGTDDDRPLVAHLVPIVVDHGDVATVDRYAAELDPLFPDLAEWLRAVHAERTSAWEECLRACSAVLLHSPDAVTPKRTAATAARHLGRHHEALMLWAEVLASDEATSSDHWERMIDATAAEEWSVVRDSCAALEIPVASETGPIAEAWEEMLLVFDPDTPEQQVLRAGRTGPVTAVVLDVGTTNDPQRFGDLVLFDATPLAVPPDDADDGDGSAEGDRRPVFRIPYATVHTITTGGYAGWVIDGARPEPHALAAFEQALAARGVVVQFAPEHGYTVRDPRGADGRIPGLFGRVAAPTSQFTASQLHDLLTHLTSGWEHPLIWLRLAEEAGADTVTQWHTIETYDL